MIEKDKISELVNKALADTDTYLVSVTVSKTNSILVTLDSDSAVTIDRCVEVSRFVEANLDRDIEDYELSVSSAGIDDPLVIRRQYLKYIGQEVAIVIGDAPSRIFRLDGISDEMLELTEVIDKKYGRLVKKTMGEKTDVSINSIKEIRPYVKL